MTEALMLTNEDVIDLASVTEYVAAVRDGFRERGEGAPTEPKTNLWTADGSGRMAAYIAILPDAGAMGGLLHATGTDGDDTWYAMPLFDVASGEVLAVVDGAGMNPLKTGAAGAVGVDVLAREDASVVGIIGSGAQARAQLRATATVRDLETIRVYSPTHAHREAFATDMADILGIDVEPVESSAAAISGADILITATTSTEPTFDGDRLEPGMHVTAMGQAVPHAREIDARTVERSTYVTDLRSRSFTGAGGFLAAVEAGTVDESHIHAELGEIVAGRAPGRRSDDEITLFDSGGTAIETVAAAHMLYEKAADAGCGHPVEFLPASLAIGGFGGT